MAGTVPFELQRLLNGPDAIDREAAWDQLIRNHTRLLLSVARSFGGDQDARMDRYTHILGKLRESDFRRLRAYHPEAGASFSTWLTVTARRLCMDHHRGQFGRFRADHVSDRSATLRAARRALGDLTDADPQPDSIVDSSSPATDCLAMRGELDAILQRELEKLGSADRLLLTLRYEDDLSAAKIARIVGMVTPFHVYRRINAILGSLRRTLEANGIEGPNG
jgi:RNA polymerase sigma factor (sigma-70 family)